MLVTADVGNSLTKLVTIRDGHVSAVVRVPSRCDALTASLAPALRQLVGNDPAEGAIITCVVPSLTDLLVMAIRDIGVARPIVLQKSTWRTFRTQYRGDLGTDRIANVAAVRDTYPLPAVVVDLGTVTKLDAFSACNEHLGGAIAPKLGLSNDALGRRCALLARLSRMGPPRPRFRTRRSTPFAPRYRGASGPHRRPRGSVLTGTRRREDRHCHWRLVTADCPARKNPFNDAGLSSPWPGWDTSGEASSGASRDERRCYPRSFSGWDALLGTWES